MEMCDLHPSLINTFLGAVADSVAARGRTRR
jgi:hypothetical protein